MNVKSPSVNGIPCEISSDRQGTPARRRGRLMVTEPVPRGACHGRDRTRQGLGAPSRSEALLETSGGGEGGWGYRGQSHLARRAARTRSILRGHAPCRRTRRRSTDPIRPLVQVGSASTRPEARAVLHEPSPFWPAVHPVGAYDASARATGQPALIKPLGSTGGPYTAPHPPARACQLLLQPAAGPDCRPLAHLVTTNREEGATLYGSALGKALPRTPIDYSAAGARRGGHRTRGSSQGKSSRARASGRTNGLAGEAGEGAG